MLTKITPLNCDPSVFHLAVCGIGPNSENILNSLTLYGKDLYKSALTLFTYSCSAEQAERETIYNACADCDWLMVIVDPCLADTALDCLNLLDGIPSVKACITLEKDMENPKIKSVQEHFDKVFFADSFEQSIVPVKTLLSIESTRNLTGTSRETLLTALAPYKTIYISPQIAAQYRESESDLYTDLFPPPPGDDLYEKVERLLYIWGERNGITKWDAIAIGNFGGNIPFHCFKNAYNCIIYNRFRHESNVCLCTFSEHIDDNIATLTLFQCTE